MATPKKIPPKGVEIPAPQALARRDDAALMFERLASDPNVPVDKLEKIIALQERIMAHNAKSAFDAAFAEMQASIPEIDEKGRIVVKGVLRSKYARNEDVQKALRPVLQRYGFALSFRTEWPPTGIIRIVGILGHREGHTKESIFEAPADHSGEKSDIQAVASTISYGHRYTTKDLLNITSRGEDTDGVSASAETVNPQTGEVTYGDHKGDLRPITTTSADGKGHGQLGRLIVIAKKSGRTDLEIKAWLFAAYGWTSKKQITREAYDAVCQHIEASGPLLPEGREPGSDDA